jgi:hypothetical protein
MFYGAKFINAANSCQYALYWELTMGQANVSQPQETVLPCTTAFAASWFGYVFLFFP